MSSPRRNQATLLKPPQAPKPPKGPQPPAGLKRLPGIKRPAGLKGLQGLTGPRSTPAAGPVDAGTLQVIQEALAARQPITAMYSDKPRELSPIALGTKGGELHLWAYQFGGESSHTCKCFTMAKFGDVDLMPSAWREPDDPGPGSCLGETLQRVGETGRDHPGQS